MRTPKTTPGVISDESDVDGLVLLDHVERDDDRVPASALPDLRAVRDRSDPSLPRAGLRVLWPAWDSADFTPRPLRHHPC